MSLGIRMRRTKRPSLFWLVALLLLWQQTALATVMCPDCLPVMAANVAQGATVQSAVRPLQSRTSRLPPLAPALPAIASLPLANASLASAFPRHGYIPPCRLLFCSLLI